MHIQLTAEDYNRDSLSVISTSCFMSPNDRHSPFNSFAEPVSLSETHEDTTKLML